MDTEVREKIHRYQSVEAKYPVSLRTAQGTMVGQTHIISTHGALIRCERPLQLHETATIRITLSEHEYLTTEGKTVWLEFSPPGENNQITPRGMVVHFTYLSSMNHLRLRTIIASHYRQKMGRKV